MRKRLRLVHTSDIHLGMYGLQDLRDEDDITSMALEAVVDAVVRLDADMLLMAGDLFDHGRVTDDLVEFFTRQLGRLSVPVVVLPGNHDCYDSTSVYRREHFRRPPENLHIISRPEGEILYFPEPGLKIWGKAVAEHSPSVRPLWGMPPHPKDEWFVALAHGHFHYEHDRDQRSSPIFPEEVASATCDYIALGHWDRYTDVSQGVVTACYSGAPHTTAAGSPGRVAVVDLDPLTGVDVYPLPVGPGSS